MLNEDGIEIYEEQVADEYIKYGFTEFGKHVNRERHIPYVYDGLKPSYRHLIQTAWELPDKFTKSVKIGSDCVGNLHMSGEASIYPIVSKLVRLGVLDGQGNHGATYLRGADARPAAPRYSEAKLKSEIRDQLNKLFDYVPYDISETGFKRYKYIPTPIPFMLNFGTIGMGYGIGIRCPAFTMKSLLEAYRSDDPSKLRFNYGYEFEENEINLQGLKDLWETGRGSIDVWIHSEEAWYGGEYGFLISCTPEFWRIKLGILEEWESQGLISIDDVSDDQPKLFIHRIKNIRKINDTDVANAIFEAIHKKIGFYCTTYNGGITGYIGIRDWIKTCYDNYTNLYHAYIDDHINKLNFEELIWNNFKRVAELILDESYSYEDILSTVNSENLSKGTPEITMDVINAIGRKSINTLRNANPESHLASINDQKEYFKSINIDNEIDSFISVFE